MILYCTFAPEFRNDANTPECRLCPWIHTPLLVQVYLASVFTEPDEEIWHKLSYICILIKQIQPPQIVTGFQNSHISWVCFFSWFSSQIAAVLATIFIYVLYCARIYRLDFRENKPKTLVFNYWKRSFWACFRESWVYKFGQWIQHWLTPSNKIPLYFEGCWDQTQDCCRVCIGVQKNVMPNFISYLIYIRLSPTTEIQHLYLIHHHCMHGFDIYCFQCRVSSLDGGGGKGVRGHSN